MSDEVNNNNNRAQFLNPVLETPWNFQSKGAENVPRAPLRVAQPLDARKRTNNIALRQANREKTLANMEILKWRFPGFKKYQLRGALNMSCNNLNKAIVLLEVSNSYGKENDGVLEDINLCLKFNRTKRDPMMKRLLVRTKTSVVDQCNCSQEDSDNERVGVVICKTPDGYQASML